MSTTIVSHAELEAIAREIQALANGFERSLAPSLQACGAAGRANVEYETERFSRRWGLYLQQCRTRVDEIGDLVMLAAEAYRNQDGLVAARTAESALIGGGRQ